MSDFVAELRVPRGPTMCLDFDTRPDDFLVELRPRPLNVNVERDNRTNCTSFGYENCASDEEIANIVSERGFSRQELKTLLHDSIVSLVNKLITGRRLARIDGNLALNFYDDLDSPLTIEFFENDAENLDITKEKMCSPHSDRNTELKTRNHANACQTFHHNRYDAARYGCDSRINSDPDLVLIHDTAHDDISQDLSLDALAIQKRVPFKDSDTGIQNRINSNSSDVMDAEDGHRQKHKLCTTPVQCNSSPRRFSPHLDDMPYNMLSPDMSFNREASCEKSPSNVSTDESFIVNNGHDIDEGDTHLVIDEDMHEEDENENKKKKKEVVETMKSKEQCEIIANVEFGRSHTDTSECNVSSKPWSNSNLVDLSGDSKNPKESVKPQPQDMSMSSGFSDNIKKNDTSISLSGANENTFVQQHATFGERERCADNDDTYGELLDLSMKKKQESSVMSSERDSREGFQLQDRAVFRDGYGHSLVENLPLTVRDMTEINCSNVGGYRRYPDHQETGTLDFTRSNISNPIRCYSSLCDRIQGLHATSDKLTDEFGTPNSHDKLDRRPKSAESALTCDDKYISRHAFSRSRSSLQRKPRFNPYSREELSQLAEKFLSIRNSKLLSRDTLSKSSVEENEIHVKLNTLLKETVLKNFTQRGDDSQKIRFEKHDNDEYVKKEPIIEISETEGDKFNSEHFYCKQSNCAKVFTSFESLEKHSVEAHGRYLCQYCEKSFTARPNRERHLRYHTGERPYKCDLCPQAFFRGDDLKYHRTTRHPSAEPIVCRQCDRTFTWSRELERHQKQSKCKP